MARRSGNKEAVLYDALKNVAVASEQNLNDDQLMEKIAKVKDVVPTRSKHEIILVLQYYEFDETAAISAFTEDGAAKALNDWNYTGNNKSKTNTRNKKKNKKKNKKDSASRESLQSTESLVSKEETSVSHQAEVNVSSLDQQQEENHLDEERKSVCDAEELNEGGGDCCPENIVVSPPTEDKADLEIMPSKTMEVPQLHEEERKDADVLQTRSSEVDIRKEPDGSRSTSQQRIPSLASSTSSSTSYSRLPSRSQGRRGLEKSLKDLSRQTAALQRVHTVLEDELQDSDRRIKAAFQEIQRILEERRLQLVQEMEKVRRDSRQLIAQRQELAIELKKRAERASSLAESDQDELRADIKQFVVERKYDDELSRTTRFVWDRDKICEELRNIGEVIHVKNCYSQRRYSVSSVASSSNLEPVEPSATNTTDVVTDLDKPEEATEGDEANGDKSRQSPVQERHCTGFPRQESRPRIFSNRGRWSPAYRNTQNNFNGKYMHRGRGGRGRGGWQDNFHQTGPPQYPTNFRDRPPNSHRRTDGNFDNSRGVPGYMHRSPRRDWHRQWNNHPSKSGQESNPKDSEVDREKGSGEGHFTKTESKENISNIVNGFVEH